MEKYFWENWKRKSELEKKAIPIILEARKLILKNIPKDKIESIYIKGSFVRREMNSKSDIDIMIVIKEDKEMKEVDKLNTRFSNKFDVPLQISGYSIKELETGELSKIKTKGLHRPLPIKLFALLTEHKLIYGMPINEKTLKRRTPEKDLGGMFWSFKEFLLPAYYKKEINFDFLIKQVLWLVYDELRVCQKNPECNWKKIENSVQDKDHIFYNAIKFRKKKSNKKEEKEFLIKLNKHLKELEKKIK